MALTRRFSRPARSRSGAAAGRRLLLAALLLTGATLGAGGGRRSPSWISPTDGEWPSYGGTTANARYSPLDEISAENISRLRIAWRWASPDQALLERDPALKTWLNEATPVMIGGVLYVSTSLSQVAALDAASGRTLWVHDPEVWRAGTPANRGWLHRGVAHWAGGGRRGRVFHASGNGWLIALDGATGRPVEGFGDGGRVDLTAGLGRPVERALYSATSPPVVVGDVVIVGSSIHDGQWRLPMPPGDVRGFDARTGRQRWIFHTVPQAGELGNETWEGGSWRDAGNTNVWTVMSADPEIGTVYLPVSTASNDLYGRERPGDNLFAESLVCLDAATGRRRWHFQIAHHGLWDYDLPAAPNLVDLVIEGRPVKAVAQVTKQGFVFLFDRETGRPLWPIEERPVPRSAMEGERSAPTQPVPARPPPFDRQGISEADLIDFTPELAQQAAAILARWDHGPLYTPPSARGAVALPGPMGGASWAGAAFDPESGWLYVTSVTSPYVLHLERGDLASGLRFTGYYTDLFGPQGLPLTKPPYGRVTAIDLARGEQRWMAPLGDGPRDHPAIRHLDLPPLGWNRRGFPLVTRTLLFVAQEPPPAGSRPSRVRGRPSTLSFAIDAPKLFVFDKATGKKLWEMDLPANAAGALMSYRAGGKQLIVVPVGGANHPAELVALSL